MELCFVIVALKPLAWTLISVHCLPILIRHVMPYTVTVAI